MLPSNYTHLIATNSHCPIAQKIIYSVLDEYGLGGVTHHTDIDLDDIEKAYKGGYFGMIKNAKGNYEGTFGLYKLNESNCEIRKMYLIPNARGKGIGEWMVNFLIQKAKDLGYKKIELETSSLLPEALQLYQKVGFKKVKTENATIRCDRVFEMEI